jgi:hypothetical protein
MNPACLQTVSTFEPLQVSTVQASNVLVRCFCIYLFMKLRVLSAGSFSFVLRLFLYPSLYCTGMSAVVPVGR